MKIFVSRGPHADRALSDSASITAVPSQIVTPTESIESVTLFTLGCPRVTLTRDAAEQLCQQLADWLDGNEQTSA